MLVCRDANFSSSTFPPVYDLLKRCVFILIISFGSLNRSFSHLCCSELRTSSSDPAVRTAADDTKVTAVSALSYLPSIITYHVN